MAIITEGVRHQIKELFLDHLTEPVVLQLFVKPSPKGLVLPAGTGCPLCSETRDLLTELRDIAPEHLTLEVIDVGAEPDRAAASGVDDVPSLLISRPDKERPLRFQGQPGGYEFGSLMEAIARVSRSEFGLSAASIEKLNEVTSPVEIMVFVTPTCPYCPSAVSLTYRLALASPHVQAIAVEANEFPGLSERYQVRGVPRTIVNRSGAFVGALPEEGFVDAVIKLAARAAAEAV